MDDRAVFRFVLSFCVSYAVFTYDGIACCEERRPQAAPCAPEVPSDQRRAALEYDGRPGVWFDQRVVQCMLRDLQELALLRERVSLLEERLGLEQATVERYERLVQYDDRVVEHLSETLEAAQQESNTALDYFRSWLRSPQLWLGIGAIIGGSIVLLSVYLAGLATG